MTDDLKLNSLDFIPAWLMPKLLGLEIRTIRQLFARIEEEQNELRDYLELSGGEFAELRKNVAQFVKDKFPEDDLPTIHPTVNKRGVAVHRLNDSSRPRFYGRK